MTTLSKQAYEFAMRIAEELPEGMGITVILSTGTEHAVTGVASNVEPDFIVAAIQGWAEAIKEAGGPDAVQKNVRVLDS